MVFRPETLEERFIRVSREQKSTLVVRADDFRADEHGVYSHAGDMGLIAWRMAKRVFSELVHKVELVVAVAGAPGAGKTTWIMQNQVSGVLYLDTMLSRRKNRREVCAMAAAAGRPIDCVLLDTDLDVCLTRNAKRSPDRRVPATYIERAHHRLTVCPPAEDEGWRQVLCVGAITRPVSTPDDIALDSTGRDL